MKEHGRRYNPCGEYTGDDNEKHYYADQTDNYLQKNYQLLFNHTFSTAWNLNVALHYTKGDGYYEEYKDGRSLIEYGLKPFTIDGTEITKSDLVRQKKMDNKFGGGVFSLNYTVNRLNASLGGGLNQYRGNNFGKVPWVKNYVGTLSPDHEYYRNKSQKTDGNIYLKANYDLTSGLSAYADLQYRHIDYTIDGNNDKYDWSKNALRPLAVDKKFDFFNPKVGLNWNITSNHRVYASFSVAQKEPTRTNYTDGDPDSYPKAEKLLDYEAGYTFANQWLTAGANFYYMDYTAPITLWDTDNRTFTAKSVADDQVALRPFQAFFVQKPTLISELTFRTDGRQATKTIDRSAAAPRMTPVVASRHFVELAITDGSTTDLTRVVVNHAASDDFCADNDATKMMADGTTPQIYTHAAGDIYAINEGAHQSGSVKVGVQIAHSGTYTITMPRNDVRARLYDYGVEVELPYTFAADEGVEDNRFTIGFDTTTTGIDAIKPGAQTDGAIYTLDGIRVSTTAPKGIYIQNHKKIVK